MCGIVGIFSFVPQENSKPILNSIKKMSSLQVRRGPDDSDTWVDSNNQVYFGFRRLAIIDISDLGKQPMISHDGISSIVFNGEIYNFKQLRIELESKNIQFRSNSDTEVLLEGLNFFGIDFLHKLNGMFAFAWYSKKTKKLILARDHAGIKPLYYYINPNGVGFGSQFNVLLHTPWGSPGSFRPDVLKLYLHLHHIPAPYGLLENTYQLEPGKYVEISSKKNIQVHEWYQLSENIDHNLTLESSVQGLNQTLIQAIDEQKFADVPLGVFLSGGIDSPLVSAITRKQLNKSIKAFCIGNKNWEQDESQKAKEFSEILGVDFKQKDISGSLAQEIISEVFIAQHEPFADFSILPTLLISKFARSHVTVSLSGDGGDELFYGYERPFSLLRNGADFRFPWIFRLMLYTLGKYHLIPKKSDVIVSKSPGHYYYEVNGRIRKHGLEKLVPSLKNIPESFNLYAFDNFKSKRQLASYARKVEFYGQLQRCLKKVDMASMHHSLEVRVPLLDKNVIDYALKIDPLQQTDGNTRKILLKKILNNYIPEEKFQKKKFGFSIPLGQWLRGPLKELTEDTLFGSDLYPEEVFEKREIEKYWKEHLSGIKDHKWGLWTLLSLQWWKNTHMI